MLQYSLLPNTLKMAKLKKRTPMKVPADMERAIQQIYDDINDIIKLLSFIKN